MYSGATNNIHSVALECNGQSGFQRSELSTRTKRAGFTTSENAKARTRLSPDRLPPTPFRPDCLSLEVRSDRRSAYPAGKGSAGILPSMAPNNRRVR
jgi:hypothetical protein